MKRSGPGPIDQLMNEYGPKGRWTELGAVLDGMDRAGLGGADQEAWFHVRGIIEYRTNQRSRAREIFEAGVQQFPNSGWLNFGLGQEYEFEGRVDDMASRFQRVRLAEVGGPAILAIARYYYLWDRLELCQQAVQPIFDAYYQLRIVDDTFLFIRGLPIFSESFGYRATFARLSGHIDAARSELARARVELAEGSVEVDNLTLEATATGDWAPLLSHLERDIASADARMPTGQLRMKRAVVRIRQAPTLDAAVVELEAVRLSQHDHAWLNNVRTLARAEACHRLGDADRERAALAAFWPGQPLLFEPNHAFSFGFLDYQEHLKPDYRGRHLR